MSIRCCVVALVWALCGCGPKAIAPPSETAPPPKDAGAAATDATTINAADAAPQQDPVKTVKLAGDLPVDVPGTDLRVHISDSTAKIGAPVATVSVLVEKSGGRKAQVRWYVEQGKFNATWVAVEGGRYDSAASKYVEEKLPGWQVRLDSVDASHTNGSPSAITVSVRKTP